MFDSPMEYCAVCGEMVTLAQTASECQRKHGCGVGQACPMDRYFSGVEDSSTPRPEKPSAK